MQYQLWLGCASCTGEIRIGRSFDMCLARQLGLFISRQAFFLRLVTRGRRLPVLLGDSHLRSLCEPRLVVVREPPRSSRKAAG